MSAGEVVERGDAQLSTHEPMMTVSSGGRSRRRGSLTAGAASGMAPDPARDQRPK